MEMFTQRQRGEAYDYLGAVSRRVLDLDVREVADQHLAQVCGHEAPGVGEEHVVEDVGLHHVLVGALQVEVQPLQVLLVEHANLHKRKWKQICQ